MTPCSGEATVGIAIFCCAFRDATVERLRYDGEKNIHQLGRPRMTKALLAMSLVFGVTGIAGADDPTKDFKKLAGTWQVVSQTEQGVAKTADEIKGLTLVIDATGKWEALKDGVVGVKGGGKIDPSKSPKAVDWTFEGSDQVALAIYEIDGDTFKHCFSLTKRPTEFASKAGSNDTYMVLKRVKK